MALAFRQGISNDADNMCLFLVLAFTDFTTKTGFILTREHYSDLADQLDNDPGRMVELDGRIVGVPLSRRVMHVAITEAQPTEYKNLGLHTAVFMTHLLIFTHH
ncbi:MAG: hypothetical protein JKY49_12100 [Cohaesibacteraceae bacterium]|nr:hypothetical protein [Cohaesibacteraceae bacterium]MBL4876962.1 hypothetical protein [Cohaesibacteraceae bacterium]